MCVCVCNTARCADCLGPMRKRRCGKSIARYVNEQRENRLNSSPVRGWLLSADEAQYYFQTSSLARWWFYLHPICPYILMCNFFLSQFGPWLIPTLLAEAVVLFTSRRLFEIRLRNKREKHLTEWNFWAKIGTCIDDDDGPQTNTLTGWLTCAFCARPGWDLVN